MKDLNTSLSPPCKKNLLWIFAAFSSFWALFVSLTSFAAKGSAPVYEDPFDIGSGGASLTRASQAGMMFSNPALIPYGPGFHRWAGNESTLIVGKESMSFANSMKSGRGDTSAAGTTKIIATIMKTPIHVGALNNLAYINRFFGLSTFSRDEFDLSAKKFSDTGLPSIRFRAESFSGVGMSLASMAFSRVVSIGVTTKYILASEPDLQIDLTDTEKIKSLQSREGIRSLVSINKGLGYDGGLLLFFQGLSNDLRLALKADDIGGTKLKGYADLKTLKQTYSLGLGYTVHTGSDAIVFTCDYRDIKNAYQEELFKRIRLGTKLLIRRHFGLGMGYYDGWPSYAVELDAFIMRLTAAAYTREYGAKPGIDPRTVYALGLTMGF
jgi:hypothetical protein